jgi:hypothetical protein
MILRSRDRLNAVESDLVASLVEEQQKSALRNAQSQPQLQPRGNFVI